MRLSDVFESYVLDKRLGGFSQHTIKAYTIQARLLVRSIGNLSASDVTPDTLRKYLIEDCVHLKPASLGHRVRFLRSLFRWAHENGIVSVNPARALREPKTGTRIPKALTQETIEELRIACESTLENVIVEFMYATGCRIGEIAQLNRRDIDLDRMSAIVLGKGDKEREVYFTTRAAIWLRRYFRERTDDDEALIVTERSPRRMSIAQIRYVLKRVAKRAEIDTVVYPHKLRHSFATHMLDNGAPIEVIQTLLGHSRSDTTRLYAQLSGERRRELYRKYIT